jgi:hypothetical protein
MKQKKVDLNALRQTKAYKNPKPTKPSKTFKDQVQELRKQYPNNQEFGAAVALLL